MEDEKVCTTDTHECYLTETTLRGEVFVWAAQGNPTFRITACRRGVSVEGDSLVMAGETLYRFLEIADFATTVHDYLRSGKTAQETKAMIQEWYQEYCEDDDHAD